MDNKITSLIKAILDKTSLTKAFDDLQSFFNRNLLHLRPKIDTKEIQKEITTAVTKTEKHLSRKHPSSETKASVSSKSDGKTVSTSASPPKTTSSEKNGIGERTMFQW